MEKPIFRITTHAIQRYLQRMRPKYRQLNRRLSGPECQRLECDLMYEVQENRKSLESEIYQSLERASEDRSWINNSEYMTRFYDKYGYDVHTKFLVDGPATFVIVSERGRDVVVTVIPSHNHIAGISANRPKYKKKIPA